MEASPSESPALIPKVSAETLPALTQRRGSEPRLAQVSDRARGHLHGRHSKSMPSYSGGAEDEQVMAFRFGQYITRKLHLSSEQLSGLQELPAPIKSPKSQRTGNYFSSSQHPILTRTASCPVLSSSDCVEWYTKEAFAQLDCRPHPDKVHFLSVLRIEPAHTPSTPSFLPSCRLTASREQVMSCASTVSFDDAELEDITCDAAP